MDTECYWNLWHKIRIMSETIEEQARLFNEEPDYEAVELAFSLGDAALDLCEISNLLRLQDYS